MSYEGCLRDSSHPTAQELTTKFLALDMDSEDIGEPDAIMYNTDLVQWKPSHRKPSPDPNAGSAIPCLTANITFTRHPSIDPW